MLRLPLLAPAPLAPWLLLAQVTGLLLVPGLTSEQVRLVSEAISVGYPGWCRWLLRRDWSRPSSQISGLTPVGTSQGGRVVYVRRQGGGAFLLPQRIAHFDDFVQRFAARTGLDLADVGRLTPPWTYQRLALLSALMVTAELVGLLAGYGFRSAST